MKRTKKALLGCLAVVGIVILVVGLGVVAVFVMPPGEPRPVERSVQERLAPPADGETEDSGGVTIQGESETSRRVSIDLEEGEFHIQPGERYGPVLVEADYDETAYKLELEQPEPDHLSVKFASTIGLIQTLARARAGVTNQNKVELFLPTGYPLELSIRVRKGMSRIDLSGVPLRSLVLDLAMGEHRVEFNQPNPEALERMLVNTKMGEFRIEGLGHAGPRYLDVKGRMGEHRLDFAGDLPAASEARVSIRMGELNVRLPAEMDVKMEPASVLLGEYNSDRPSVGASDPELDGSGNSLTLRINVLMGEANVH